MSKDTFGIVFLATSGGLLTLAVWRISLEFETYEESIFSRPLIWLILPLVSLMISLLITIIIGAA